MKETKRETNVDILVDAKGRGSHEDGYDPSTAMNRGKGTKIYFDTGAVCEVVEIPSAAWNAERTKGPPPLERNFIDVRLRQLGLIV